MNRKSEVIRARVSKQTKQLFCQLAKQEGMDGSKLLRTLIHNYERPFTLSPEQLETLRYHFTNAARLGGLLNQIAYHLNSEHVKVQGGSEGEAELDAKELQTLCRDLEREVQDLKQEIIRLCRNHQVS